MLQKMKYRVSVLKRLYPLAAGVRKLFVIDCAAAVAVLLLSLLQPLFYRIFIEDIILKKTLRLLPLVVCGYVGIRLADTVLAFLRNRCHYRLNNQVTLRMKEVILRKILRRDITEYLHVNPGNEKMVMDDAVVRLCDFSHTQTSDYLVNYGKMLVLLVMLFGMEWRLALILVAAVPVSFLLNHRNGVKAKRNNDELWVNDRKWNAWNYDTAAAWREIRAMNMESFCEKKFLSYVREYRRLRVAYIRHWVTRHFVIPAIKDDFIMQFLLYFLGGIFLFRGYLTIGTLLVFAQYYAMLTDAVQAVVGADTELMVGRTYYDRALAVMEGSGESGGAEFRCAEESGETKVECADGRGEEVSPRADGFADTEVVFDHVSFAYGDGEKKILSDFSMRILPGERVGIVGESGRGKTTLLNLLVGILRPQAGSITIGGAPVERIRDTALFARVGFVMQENMLFNTTIRENLFYGKEDATEEELLWACEKAHIREFIAGLPEGLDTVIGERGIKLSGGQKQRLVLARLFLRDVDLYIFDEATSALDQHNERLVQDAIRAIGRDKTILVVAHRKSSLAICERLVYL